MCSTPWGIESAYYPLPSCNVEGREQVTNLNSEHINLQDYHLANIRTSLFLTVILSVSRNYLYGDYKLWCLGEAWWKYSPFTGPEFYVCEKTCFMPYIFFPFIFFPSLLTDAVLLGAKQRHVTNACTQQSCISTKPASVCFQLTWMLSNHLSQSRTSASIFNR